MSKLPDDKRRARQTKRRRRPPRLMIWLIMVLIGRLLGWLLDQLLG